MTGQIFPWPTDPHREVELLVPWYATDQLDEADRARLDRHLPECAVCRETLAQHRELARHLPAPGAPPGSPPGSLNVETGWAAMQGSTALPAMPGVAVPARATPGRRDTRMRWFGALAAAQIAALLVTGSILLPERPTSDDSNPDYRALGAAPAATGGNLIVIFKPETSEALLRQTLRDSGARLVDGPTAANAYLLRVPEDRRDEQLAKLRAQPQVLLAEPIEPGERP
jgi:hypothetical protein